MKNIICVFIAFVVCSFFACQKNDEDVDEMVKIIENNVYDVLKKNDNEENNDSTEYEDSIIYDNSTEDDSSNIIFNKSFPDSIRMNINARCTPEYSLFVAHAGGRLFGPPNSIPAFVGSAMIGMWGCETDIRPTADGVLVCYHDNAVDDGTDGTGMVNELTYEQISKLKIKDYSNSKTFYDYSKYSQHDLRIPTAEEFIYICLSYKMVPVFHVKTWTAIKQLVKLIDKYGLNGKCLIASTIPDHFRMVRETGSQERVHLFWGHSSNIDEMLSYGNASFSYDISDPDDDIAGKEDYGDYHPTKTYELIDMCNQLGMNACLKGTNQIERAKKLADMGVAFITTDYLYTDEGVNTGIVEIKH